MIKQLSTDLAYLSNLSNLSCVSYMSGNPKASNEQEIEQSSQRTRSEDEWMTLQDATAYTKIKRGTLYQLMKDHILPWYRVAGTSQRRFKRSDLDRLMIPGHLEDSSENVLPGEDEDV
jgi:excisionase family DNA binding protein